MKKHEMKCTNCNSTGSMQTQQGQVFPCGQCQGTGAVNRPEVGPQDYVFEYTIPAGATQVQVPALTILSYDFLLRWLVAASATLSDQVMLTDNTGYQWMNTPVQLANWAGSGQLPFPLQPNLLLKKNTTIAITVYGAPGHSGEIALKGINLADVPAALTTN